MTNSTDLEREAMNELLRLVHNHGIRISKELKDRVAQGTLNPYRKVDVALTEENIRDMIPTISQFPLTKRLIMRMGTPEFSNASHYLIVTAAVYTGSKSAVNYAKTLSKSARLFYLLSTGFSSAAALFGSNAVLAKSCQLSGPAFLSESFGAVFLHLGNQAHQAALIVENKAIPLTIQQKYGDQATLQNLRRKLSRKNNNGQISYIMPGNRIDFSEIIVSIPFEKIGQTVGFTLTIYGYYRITIAGYRYSRKLISKFSENRKKNKLRKLRKNYRLILEFLVTAYSPIIKRELLYFKVYFILEYTLKQVY